MLQSLLDPFGGVSGPVSHDAHVVATNTQHRQPVTEKKTRNEASRDLGLLWGVGEMQGWRPTMEDDHVATSKLAKEAGWTGTGLFGVFDGHGGADVAHFCAQHLHKAVAKGNASAPEAALRNSFQMLDRKLADAARTMKLRDAAHPDHVGCTAATCLIRAHDLIVASAGDSRVVLSRKGQAMDLSEDHKPGSPGEVKRIKAAGGFVMEQKFGPHTIHRVNGELSVSRAIGDLRFKKDSSRSQAEQMITCVPDTRTFRRHPDDEFLVIACDGIWDVLSSQEVVARVHKGLPAIRRGELQPTDVISSILDDCLADDPQTQFGRGGDNMTMLLVVFQESAAKQKSWFDNIIRPDIMPSCVCAAPRIDQATPAARAAATVVFPGLAPQKRHEDYQHHPPLLLGSRIKKGVKADDEASPEFGRKAFR